MPYREEQRLMGWLPVRMSIEVDETDLHLRLGGVLAPLSRTIPLEKIKRVRLRERLVMRPFERWGLLAGVGVKVAPGLGRIYNFGQDEGVGVELTDGTSLVIGSRQPEQLLAAIEGGA